jgi:hypothetical protein
MERAELLTTPTLTMAQTALVLDVGMTNLRDSIRRGELPLPVIAIGSRRVIPTAAVRELVGIEQRDAV